MLRSSQKASPLAVALGGESASLNLQVSAEKCFLPTPISFSNDLPCQDTCLSFPASLALLSSVGEAQGRRGKLSSVLSFRVSVSIIRTSEPTHAHHSILPCVGSAGLWDLVLPIPSSSCYLCADILLLHLPLYCPRGSSCTAEPSEISPSSSLLSHGVASGEEGEQENGENEHIFKGKRIGETIIVHITFHIPL